MAALPGRCGSMSLAAALRPNYFRLCIPRKAPRVGDEMKWVELKADKREEKADGLFGGRSCDARYFLFL